MSTMQLIDAVTRQFSTHKHPKPSAWLEYLDPRAQDIRLNVQRYYINDALRNIIITEVNNSDLEVRSCLVNTGSDEDWLNLVNVGVIPYFIKNEILFE